MDWTKAEDHLNDMMDKYLHKGSIGVVLFMERVFPLRDRFRKQERTQELYDAIFAIEPACPAAREPA